jgi:archaeosine-15-forming tRNA-guanine transglycosylase
MDNRSAMTDLYKPLQVLDERNKYGVSVRCKDTVLSLTVAGASPLGRWRNSHSVARLNRIPVTVIIGDNR